MMNNALVFGYNEFAMQIASQLKESYEEVYIYVSDEDEKERALDDGFNATIFDFGDDWEDLQDKHNLQEFIVFSALQDDAQNVFLTISLRASFEELYIIALAKNQESSNKLKMAGANKVLPVLQMTANLIVEILEKPVVTDVLHKILYEKSDLQIAQISLKESSNIIGVKLQDIIHNEQYGVILIAIVDQQLQSTFIFTAKGYNHFLCVGDILVVVGYEKEIKIFEKEIGGSRETDRSHWSR
ncbi:MAG: NAD-binding protein [Campylobacterota bacterium]|nr:NAD-binding protein [Campylobacterota bacterium]